MKIVYDMSTGEIIERAVEPRRRSASNGRARQAISVPETALRLEEHRWSDEKRSAPPTFLACYFDEYGN